MRRAAVVVVPSIWYEPCPLVVIEAFACGTPVIASKIGALSELVVNGVTGIHVTPADSGALAEAIGQMLQDPQETRKMGIAARQSYLERFAPATNRIALEDIYHKAIMTHRSRQLSSRIPE
jgi:glycosyltransferase involved in cell wall biosynthesis